MTTTPAVTLVVLSEDSGREGWSSLHRVTRITVDTILSDLDWERGIEIIPRDEVPVEVQRICAGNRWRSGAASDVPRKGALFRYVARLLDEGRDRPQYEEWARDRGSLDEAERLKDQAQERGLHCLRDVDKDYLAREFPADAVFEAGKSYAAWVNALLDDAEFMGALERARFSSTTTSGT